MTLKGLKSLSTNFVNRKKTVKKEPLCFQKIIWFRFSKCDPAMVSVRYTLKDDEPWSVWNIKRQR